MKGTHQIYLFAVTILAAGFFFFQRSFGGADFPYEEGPVEIGAVREHNFGEALFEGDSLDYGRLLRDFGPMVASRPDRMFWAAERENRSLKDHYINVEKLLDLDAIHRELVEVGARAKYHLSVPAPSDIYYYISGIDLEDPCLYVPFTKDSATSFVGLDNFLGPGYPGYGQLPAYQRELLRPNQIPVAYAQAIIERTVATPEEDATLLGAALFQGKRAVAARALCPDLPEHEVLGFTEDQWIFLEENEAQIWEFLVREQMLFKTDFVLRQRLVEPAPFSKLGTAMDAQLPGRVGVFIGYKIALHYARNKQPSLIELFKVRDAQRLLRESKYKP